MALLGEPLQKRKSFDLGIAQTAIQPRLLRTVRYFVARIFHQK